MQVQRRGEDFPFSLLHEELNAILSAECMQHHSPEEMAASFAL